MDAEPGRHWIDDAKCQDPLHVGCNWSGRIWIELKPEENCEACPNCGGYSFTARLLVERQSCERRLTGWTP